MKRKLIEQLKAHFQTESNERALLMLRFLPIRDSSSTSSENEVIAPGSLVRLEIQGRQSWVFIVPQHGGLVTDFEGDPIQVLTPQSPLGESLLGHKQGDQVELKTYSGTSRVYRVISTQ